MKTIRTRLTELLQQHFGFSSFRPGQAEIMEEILKGKSVLGILPTGGGKSMLYQLLSLALPGITIVVSPLISLMLDQVARLRQSGQGFAVSLNSAQEAQETRDILADLARGRYRLLYLSPEKLQQPLIRKVLQARGVSLVAIDEAHCITQWGHDFRTDYLRLPAIVSELGHPPVLAVTATATAEAKREICRLFRIPPEQIFAHSMDRPNLSYEVIPVESELDKRERLVSMMLRLQGPGIVYCATRQAVEMVALSCRLAGMERVHAYHGGMNALERMLVQEQFLRGELDVIVATNAFGMGIDKPDIRFVLHYHFPASLEAYVQEVGRVGRDGLPGYAALYYLAEDVHLHQRILTHEYPDEAGVHRLLGWMCQERPREIPIAGLDNWLGLSEQEVSVILFYAEHLGLVTELQQTRTGFSFQLRAGSEGERQVREEICQLIRKAKQNKLAKLHAMAEWLQRGTCLRTGLLQYFGEDQAAPGKKSCCSVCGLDRRSFERTGNREHPRNQRGWELQSALDQLLPPYSAMQREASGE